jgi:hypothetical protein
MKDSKSPNRNYKHLLRYDQCCEWGIMYGFNDLYYDLDASNLYMRKNDLVSGSKREAAYDLKALRTHSGIALENFLIEFIASPSILIGDPHFESSEIFTEEDFNKIKSCAYNLIEERKESARLAGAANELIQYCISIHLQPEPHGSCPTNWISRCLSGSDKHSIFISTISNQWGCGYCKRKGDLNALKEWYAEKNPE